MKDFKPNTIKVGSGSWTIFYHLCKGCGICLAICPQKSLVFSKQRGVYSNPAAQVVPEKCTLCGLCEEHCPDCAIRVEKND